MILNLREYCWLLCGHRVLSLSMVGEVECFPLPFLLVQLGSREEKGLEEMMGDVFT